MASGVVGIQRVTDGKLKDARELRREMTQTEEMLWEQLRNRQCGGFKFRRQQIIEGFIADFYCEQAQLVVEVDGGIHNDPDVKANDVHREKVFKARGIITLRFGNNEVEQQAKVVVKKIEDMCKNYLRPTNLSKWEITRIKKSNQSPLSL
jgi:very-short-patch-repair endonuclease